MENQVFKTLKKYDMISPGDSVVVGLSGGADSVALLLCLKSLSKDLNIKKIVACHVNHNLRDTAKRDENFSKELCKSLGIECFVKNVDISSLKKVLKVCEEDAGRIARYDFFHEIKEKINADKIATAHNLNDQIETFFIRLLRGASLDGFASVKPVREDGIIRPLIETKREEIEEYLIGKNQKFVTDETNFKPDYLRNKVRLSLLPFLKENFEFREDVVLNTMKLFSVDSSYIRKEVDYVYSKGILKEDSYEILADILQKSDEAVLSRVIKKIANDKFSLSLSGRTIENTMKIIKEGKTGKELPYSKEIYAFLSYGKFIVKKRTIIDKYVYKLKPGDNYIKEAGIIATLSTEKKEGENVLKLSDASDLLVRSRKTGDKVFINKVGHKKVKDIFIDSKIPREHRAVYPIIESGNEIRWIPGLYKKEDKNGEYYLSIRRMGNEK